MSSPAELAGFLDANGGSGVLKTPTGGYDGRGVRVVRSADEAADWFADGDLLVEELVSFRRELAQLVARRPSGELVAWPVVESVQMDGVCAEVIAPAPTSSQKLVEVALEIATTLASALDVRLHQHVRRARGAGGAEHQRRHLSHALGRLEARLDRAIELGLEGDVALVAVPFDRDVLQRRNLRGRRATAGTHQ